MQSDLTVADYLIRDRFAIILFVCAFLRLRSRAYRSMTAAALFEMPGTIFHELSHFIMGILTNAQPTKISVWPEQNDDGTWSMGSVTLSNITWYNCLPVGLAPLLMFPAAFWIERNFFEYIEFGLLSGIAYLLLIVTLIENCLPSKADIRIAFSDPRGLTLVGGGAAAGYYVMAYVLGQWPQLGALV